MGVGIITGSNTRELKTLREMISDALTNDMLVVGTSSQISAKIDNNEIPDGAIVIITDDDGSMDDYLAELTLGDFYKKTETYSSTEIDNLIEAKVINSGVESEVTGDMGSRAEGYKTTASGTMGAHAEGRSTLAEGTSSHAEGGYTKATGLISHAEGWYTEASKNNAHAEGSNTIASETDSHAQGSSTKASNYASFAGGKYNVEMEPGTEYDTNGTAFVIGNGLYGSPRRNAMSLMFDGTFKTAGTMTSSTSADYAEYFEWKDGNPDDEDRVGIFVTLDGDKIVTASSDDEYILGVVSGSPCVLGNGDCDVWNGLVLRDEFRRPVIETVQAHETIYSEDGKTRELKPVFDDEGKPVYVTRQKMNPEYDESQAYISRRDRKEWSAIGMLGVLAVKHDGTLKVNGYATVGKEGIATSCDIKDNNSYRVIKVISETVAEIIFR